MAFIRQKAEEPPVEQVGWADVQTFVVSSVERPETAKRRRAVWGKPAIRVARGSKDLRVLAPCAFLGSEEVRPAEVATLPGLSAALPRHTLYEDADRRRLLCYVEPPAATDEDKQQYAVRDAAGQVVGTLTRVPPKRPFRHTWRIEQPGHPEIVGRNEWLSGDAKEIAGRVTGRFLGGVLNAVADVGSEGGDQRAKPRSLDWRAADRTVMVSEGSKRVTVRAGWVDRRLAFAFALVGDE
ncbi:hypothetical protein ACH4CD_30980 [Streptomyces fungicidicus]|uniref:hypothetical protein n=1 Tax=Streptomyces fungicidicus TaxID=68203 RepID=UPI0037B908B3